MYRFEKSYAIPIQYSSVQKVKLIKCAIILGQQLFWSNWLELLSSCDSFITITLVMIAAFSLLERSQGMCAETYGDYSFKGSLWHGFGLGPDQMWSYIIQYKYSLKCAGWTIICLWFGCGFFPWQECKTNVSQSHNCGIFVRMCGIWKFL